MLHQQPDLAHRFLGWASGAGTWARDCLLPVAIGILVPSPANRIRQAFAGLPSRLNPLPALGRLVAPAVSHFRRHGAPPPSKGAPVNLLQLFTKEAAPVEAAVQLGEKIVQLVKARASLFVTGETIVKDVLADASADQQEAAIKAFVDASPLPESVKAFAENPDVLDAAMRIEDILRRDVLHQPGLPAGQAQA